MELHLKITAVFLMGLAAIHPFFPRYFNWKQEFRGLSLINRQMIHVHAFFITLTLILMALLCWTAAAELVETPLGRKVALGLGIFWSARLFIQFFGYSPKLWRHKPFETGMHIAFTGLWIYFSLVFFRVFWMG